VKVRQFDVMRDKIGEIEENESSEELDDNVSENYMSEDLESVDEDFISSMGKTKMEDMGGQTSKSNIFSALKGLKDAAKKNRT